MVTGRGKGHPTSLGEGGRAPNHLRSMPCPKQPNPTAPNQTDTTELQIPTLGSLAVVTQGTGPTAAFLLLGPARTARRVSTRYYTDTTDVAMGEVLHPTLTVTGHGKGYPGISLGEGPGAETPQIDALLHTTELEAASPASCSANSAPRHPNPSPSLHPHEPRRPSRCARDGPLHLHIP
jgi:hypothetical protein